ncbi:MAG: flagellar export chaperone FliS [Candidatus Azotimanducaceae bacterium]
MAPKTALQSYQAIDTQGLTESQSPEKLILLLMEKAHSLLKQAKAAIECGNNESFYESTTKVAQIVLSLRELLDMESGGELAEQLYQTYSAIASSVFKLKQSKNVVDLSKITSAVGELRDGWKKITAP